jgi:serine/threonine protein phosphatase PrpC
MGAGASAAAESLDGPTARSLAGEHWDEELFNSNAEGGVISRAKWESLVQAHEQKTSQPIVEGATVVADSQEAIADADTEDARATKKKRGAMAGVDLQTICDGAQDGADDSKGDTGDAMQADPLFKSIAFAEDANETHRESMEDAHIIDPKFNDSDALFAVLDGHGGREVVDAACAQLPVNLLAALKAKEATADATSARGAAMDTALQEAFAKTDTQMPRRVPQFKMTSKLDFCGCTAVVAWLSGSLLVTANIGDARAVLGKTDGTALRLTVDHKATDDAERALVEGKGGAVEDGRVEGTCAVTRAFGDHGLKRFMSCEPYTTVTDLKGGGYSCLVLACDGVWDVMSDEEAIELVTDASLDAEETAAQLVQEALRKGSDDNVTAMVIFL